MRTLILVSGILSSAMGCTDLTGRNNDEYPSGVPDPATLDNPAGALGQYRQAVFSFLIGQDAVLREAIVRSGLLGDELQSSRLGRVVTTSDLINGEFAVDARQVTGLDYTINGGSGLYVELHHVRKDTRLAAAALRKHGAAQWAALRGLMFTLEGYAEILLADLYCSGVPLSTIDPEGDYTYQPGSTTQAVYVHALTLFDSALAVSSDSTRILNLARIGKARALLNLGRYPEAAQVAASVPDGFAYQFKLDWRSGVGSIGDFSQSQITVANREGRNGLPFRSSRDPRTTVVRYGTNSITRDTLWFPAKYGTQTSVSPMTLGDAVEARLIEAEAALHQQDVTEWLTRLNTLRTDGTFTTRPNATDPTRTDTLWNAGTGGMAGLAPLKDPGTLVGESAAADARIDLLFAERAAWLFLTGHRQGDLRRLVRGVSDGGYGRDAEQVYPTGAYLGGPLLSEFGQHVALIIPEVERRNPYFTGCQES